MTQRIGPRTVLFLAACFVGFGLAGAASTRAASPEEQPAKNDAAADALPRHTLIYGGDFFCARRLNYALLAPRDDERKAAFRDVAPLLRKADVAMINLEGMVTRGGYYNRLEECSYMYRAAPGVIGILEDAGVDIVTTANNHNGDYGPEGTVEEVDRLAGSKLEFVGSGVNWDDASRTLYRQVGDTVFAVVNMEISVAKLYKAEANRPGIHYLTKAFVSDKGDQTLIDYLTKRVREARRHAHLVFYSPHWDCGGPEPVLTPAMRRFAPRLIKEAGFDAVLAHGQHVIEGVEVVNGKPILYDAGNCFADFDTRKPLLEGQARGIFWQVEFSKAGVHRVEAIPLHMEINRTHIASGEQRKKSLERLDRLARECGTTLTIANGRASLDVEPGGVLEPTEGPSTPKRPQPTGPIRLAPTDVLHERLPKGVKPLNVAFENGVRLVGHEMLFPKLIHRDSASQTIVLYWTTDRPIKENYVVHIDSRPVLGGRLIEDKVIREEPHLPGDWMLPSFDWPVGKIIQDKQNLRMAFREGIPEAVEFFAGLRKWTGGAQSTMLTPIDAGGTKLFHDQLVPLGRTPVAEDAPSARSCYEKWRETRDIQLCPEQPDGRPLLNWPPQYGGN